MKPEFILEEVQGKLEKNLMFRNTVVAWIKDLYFTNRHELQP
jgi:hypothetical protein